MPLDFSGHIKIRVPIPYSGGHEVVLHLRRPTWDQADTLLRQKSEHTLRLADLYRKFLDKAKKEAEATRPQNIVSIPGSKAPDPEIRISPEDRAQMSEEQTMLEREFYSQVAPQAHALLVGFTDRDGNGEPLFSWEGEPLLASDMERSKKALWDMLGRDTFGVVWEQLVEQVRPSDREVRFQGEMTKN